MLKKSKQLASSLDTDEIYRAKWTQATKIAYFKDHPENFAGPNMSYPIKDASDVNDAARLAGHADNANEVRSKIIEIARRLGFESALPDSWKDEDGKADKKKASAERAMKSDDDNAKSDDEEDDDDESGDDGGDNDNSDNEEDNEEDSQPPAKKPSKKKTKRSDLEPEFIRSMPHDITYYAPIVRINKEKREVIGTATTELKDAHGTIIGYDASKDAFGRWVGNIREMHDPKKAVGHALEVIPDDTNRRIIVRAMISKGAEDTWQKILDGTLTGFSIGGRNGKWTQRVIDGEKIPFLERYDQSELSLVDNPSNPGANDVAIVRADGLASDVLADEDEIVTAPKAESKVERAGARLSKETIDAMHTVRDHSMNAAKSSMDTCGCDECTAMLNKVNETDDNDGDMDANFLAQPAARATIAEIVRGVLDEALRDQFAPVSQRVNALLARQAQHSDEPDPQITRRVDDLSEKLGKIYDLIEKIAAQPADGGPILHGAPIDKRLATQSGTTRSQSDADTIQRAMELGFAPPTDVQEQIRLAAKMIRH